MAKKRREMTAQAKRRLIVFGPLCILLMVYFFITVISYTINLYQLRKEMSSLEQQYLELQEKTDALKVEISKLQTPEYLAKFARENYLYSTDKELIIKINETKEDIQVQEKDIEKNRFIVVGCIIVVALIFIYILIRGKKKRNRSLK